jgi:glyoxylase-like metal-dependent hydrolase (beta-lactamase superfamily II)
MDFQYQGVGSRGHLFTFSQPYRTNVYVIDALKNIFVLDTFLGKKPMRSVKKKLEALGVKDKPYVVFLSHGDYDHYWGNGEFKESMIIAHTSCRTRIERQGDEALEKYKHHMIGDVEIVLPNLIFRRWLSFPDDSVEFFYTPGHTGDSASCFDKVDKVLFVGDNIEHPLPYVNLLNLKEYSKTLKDYLKYDVTRVISGHDLLMYNTRLIEENQGYLENLRKNQVNIKGFTEMHYTIHFNNLTRIGELYLRKGMKTESLGYYKEALRVLEDMEPSAKTDEKRSKVQGIISELS